MARINLLRIVVATMLGITLLPASSFAQSAPAVGPSDQDLTTARSAGKDWITFGGSTFNERFSTLDQINTGNVAQLKGAWMTRLGSGRGAKYKFEADPIVVDGVMYIPTGNDDIFALDGKTGKKVWEYNSDIPQVNDLICCGWDNRGVAAGEGMIFSGQLDGSFVALDQKTGKVVWRTQLEDYHDGYSITGATRYFNGMVFTGMSGGENGIRGRVYGLDAKTGAEIWRFYTIPAPGENGSNSWPNDGFAYQHGGGTVWQAPAIDPDLGMLYFTTGNAGPWNGDSRPGDNLFATSFLALDYKTGAYKWHFQEVHHDIWDFDAPSPTVLFDTTINGQPRKGIYQCGKTGWCYILDRTNGQPLVGIDEQPVPQEPRQNTSPTQPIPKGDAFVNQCAEPVEGFPVTGCIFTPFWDTPVLLRPTASGGSEFSPTSYNPNTGYLYVNGLEQDLAFANKPVDYVPGKKFVGVTITSPLGANITNTLSAIDVTTNKIAWQKHGVGEENKGSLSTAGGLLFTGQADGNMKAYDAKTGDELWSFQVGWGVGAPPMSYQVGDTQYVAVAVGGNRGGVTTLDGDSVWAFSLNGTLDQVAPAPPVSTKVEITGRIVKAGDPIALPGNQYDNLTFSGTVPVDDFYFTPKRVQVSVGDTVTFQNNGALVHTATESHGVFDTGDIAPGESRAVTFDTAGTYVYNCSPHPWMIGQIIVQ
ncbi:MAG: PQQ-binding-like beta-propeller repeat protein [Chloroflexi bacterium]|nr:PQQ-binding-like beta-propeller repeat protein [Chloroflexota bacterium]